MRWWFARLYACVSPNELSGHASGAGTPRVTGLLGPDQDSSLPSYPLVESAVLSHRDAGF